MAVMRFRFFLSSALLISTLTFAEDPTKFLIDPGAQIDGAQQVISGAPAEIYSQLFVSLLRSAAGVPRVPVLPIIVSSEPRLIRNKTEGATLQRTSEILTTTKLAELAGELIISGWVGDHDLEPGDLSLINQHIVNLSPTGAFKSFGDSEENFATYFSAKFLSMFPRENFQNLTPEMKENLLEQMNQTITRIEKMNLQSLSSITKAIERAGRGQNILKELRTRQSQIRLLVARALGSAGAPLLKPATVDTPFIHLPGEADNAATQLWSNFLQSSKEMRLPPGTLTRVQMEARNQTAEFFGVYPNSAVHFTHPLADEPVQISLLPNNNQTLFVIPINDDEAVLISAIAERAGAHVLKINAAHGVKLTPGLVAEIEANATRVNASRVFVVEIPPANGQSHEADLKQKIPGYEFIDHHDYGGKLDRYFFGSSLEQSADVLGYDLGRSGRAVGIMDANYIWGLRDFGITKEEMQAVIKSNDTITIKSGLYQTRFGPFVMITENSTPISKIAVSIARNTWPEIPNILMFDGGHGYGEFRVSGRADFVESLFKIWKSAGDLPQPPYMGGDPLRSRFAGIKKIPAEAWPKIRNATLEFVQQILPAGEKFADAKLKVSAPESLVAAPDAAQKPNVIQKLWTACSKLKARMSKK
jgi:hypothetical protein